MSNLQTNWAKKTFAVFTLAILASGCEPVETSSTTPTTNITVSDAPTSQSTDSPSVQLVAQVQQLNQEIGGLRDRVDILEFELEKARERQKQLYDDLDLRLRKFERQQSRPTNQTRQTDATSSAESPESDTATQPETTAESQEESEPSVSIEIANQPVSTEIDLQAMRDAYDGAFRTLKTGNFDEAKTKFQEFIESYPSSDLVDDAWYWIAESNYITKEFEQAIKLYQYVARQYPDYQRAHEALLKIGYIYYELENYEEAQLYLNEVLDKFPASRSAFSAQRRLNKMKRDGIIQ